MEEQLVTFETAKLAKEKGFECIISDDTSFYQESLIKDNWVRTGFSTNFFWSKKKYDPKIKRFVLAPTQSILQKWLRDVHNMHILMNVGMHDSIKQTFYCNVFLFGVNLYKGKFRSKTSIYTYEEALEKGLQAALKLI